MIDLRHHFRLTGIVVMAIAGMLLMAGGAPAWAAAGSQAKGAGSCCGRAAGSCGCCGPARTTRRTGLGVSLASVGAARSCLSVPTQGCECRSGDQPPASNPQSQPRAEGRQPVRDRREAIVAMFQAALPFAWLVAEPTRTSESPRYLRNERLLI